jgi:predicted N-acyltransferase
VSARPEVAAPPAGAAPPTAAPASSAGRIRFIIALDGGIEVTAWDTIHAIPPEVWDAVVPEDEVQSSHAFAAACEDADVEHASYWHLTIRRDAELVGVASLFIMPVRLDLLASGLVRSALQQVRRFSPRFLRPNVLFCGLPVSAGRPCLAARSDGDLPDVLHAVARAIDAASDEAAAQLHCVKEFSPAEVRGVDALLRHGFFRVPSLPTFHMAVPWTSTDAYLADMRAGYRRQVLASRRLAQREGLRVRRCADVAPCCDRFFALYEQVMDRAEFQLERLNAAFFRNLATRLPDRTSALLVERGDQVVAGAILLHTRGRLTFLVAGIDYAVNRRSGAYVCLVAEIVAEAIQRRAPLLELGQTSPELKSRLGAAGEDRFIYFRCPSRSAHIAFRTAAGIFYPSTPLPKRRVFRERHR